MKAIRLEVRKNEYNALKKPTFEKIGVYKKENKVTVFQPERWNEIIESRKNTADILEIDLKFIKEYIDLIHKESIRLQTQIVNNKKDA